MIAIGGFLLSNDADLAFTWAKVFYSFPLLIAATMPLFARTFPNNSKLPHSWTLPIVGGYLLIAIPTAFIPSFLTGEVVYHEWGKEVVLNKAHYLAYSGYLLVCFFAGLLHTHSKSRRLHGLFKLQTSFFFIGFLLTSLFGVLFNLIYPWFGNYRMIWLGPLFSNAFIIATGYSIIKHRMFDIRAVVARSVGYILAVSLLGVFYGATTYTITNTLSHAIKSANVTSFLNIVVLIAAAMLYGPIKIFFDNITKRIFYRDAYDPQQFLDELNNVLVSNIKLDKLLEESMRIIEKNLKSQFVIFSIRETAYFPVRLYGDSGQSIGEQEIQLAASQIKHIREKVIITDHIEEPIELKDMLTKNNITMLVKLVSTLDYEVGGLGHVFFGDKKSGNSYGKQDIRIMEIIANELVIAIQNALRFEEIENFNITLQKKVEEATRELRKTNEKLKVLDETKDEFISMASHQLRTPLTSVKGYLSMVLEGDAGEIQPMQRKLLDQAFTSSQRMVYLIADLLNVSRLRTGKFIIEPVVSNLADVVEGEIGQLKETAAGRGLKLTYQKPDKFPVLYLDEIKIRQVVMNFIDNAIYYTPKGGHIMVKLEDMGESIELTVNDDGMGVPKHEQQQLFTKFYRADNAQKARPDGTGLGLFMAKKVIVAQGGSLIFRSQENKGSCFGFSLPKQKLQAPFKSPEQPS